MLFVTNRFPEQSIRTHIGRKFDFDLFVIGPGSGGVALTDVNPEMYDDFFAEIEGAIKNS